MTERASVPRERLNYVIQHGAPHYRPIWLAVRDFGCNFALVPQHAGEIGVDLSIRPFIFVVGDDMHEALGPAAFHRPSLEAVMRACRYFAVVSCEALPEVYAAAASFAVTTRCAVMLIETRPRYEGDWIELVEAINPTARMTVATVRPEGSA